MFCLDAVLLNHDLCERAQNLKDRLIQYQVDVNRETNTRYKNFREKLGCANDLMANVLAMQVQEIEFGFSESTYMPSGCGTPPVFSA